MAGGCQLKIVLGGEELSLHAVGQQLLPGTTGGLGMQHAVAPECWFSPLRHPVDAQNPLLPTSTPGPALPWSPPQTCFLSAAHTNAAVEVAPCGLYQG